MLRMSILESQEWPAVVRRRGSKSLPGVGEVPDYSLSRGIVFQRTDLVETKAGILDRLGRPAFHILSLYAGVRILGGTKARHLLVQDPGCLVRFSNKLNSNEELTIVFRHPSDTPIVDLRNNHTTGVEGSVRSDLALAGASPEIGWRKTFDVEGEFEDPRNSIVERYVDAEVETSPLVVRQLAVFAGEHESASMTGTECTGPLDDSCLV